MWVAFSPGGHHRLCAGGRRFLPRDDNGNDQLSGIPRLDALTREELSTRSRA